MRRYLLASTILLAGCGGGGGNVPVVRDSVGVTIVENSGPLWERGERWRLSATPLLDLGRASGDRGDRFTRAVSSTLLSDGTVVVADGETREVRWFDSQGEQIRSAGGLGLGPGSFERLEWISALDGDKVIAYDYRSFRLSIFDRNGNLESTSALVIAGESRGGTVTGMFVDSAVLLISDRRSWIPPLLRVGSRTRGLVRGPAIAYRYDLDGSLLNNLGTFEGSEQILTGIRYVHANPRPFGRNAVFAAAGDRFYAGTQDEYQVLVHDRNGELNTIVRRLVENQPVTEAIVERYKEVRLAGLTGIRERMDKQRELDSLPFPNAMPAYRQLRADASGNLWVAEYRYPSDEPPTWSVFDNEFQYLGLVETPEGFEIHEIGSDYVLGVAKDADGVEHVRMYALEKP